MKVKKIVIAIVIYSTIEKNRLQHSYIFYFDLDVRAKYSSLERRKGFVSNVEGLNSTFRCQRLLFLVIYP